MMESDEDNSDNGRTFATGATGFTRMTSTNGKSLRSATIARSERIAAGGRRSVLTSNMAKTSSSSLPRIRAERDGGVMDMLDSGMSKNVRFDDDTMG